MAYAATLQTRGQEGLSQAKSNPMAIAEEAA
jgi:hypothetical protein